MSPLKWNSKKVPNIVSLPQFEVLPDEFDLEVLLKVGDDISTDGDHARRSKSSPLSK